MFIVYVFEKPDILREELREDNNRVSITKQQVSQMLCPSVEVADGVPSLNQKIEGKVHLQPPLMRKELVADLLMRFVLFL